MSMESIPPLQYSPDIEISGRRITAMFAFMRLIILVCLIGIPNLLTAQSPKDSDASESIRLFLPIRTAGSEALIDTLQKDLMELGLGSIQIETIDHWHSYQQGIRLGRPAFYFAPPHFAAWVVSQYKFRPLLKISKPISYVIAVERANRDLFEVSDIANRKVCSDKPFTLDYLIINKNFGDTYYSAKIEVVESVSEQMRNSQTRCEAFSLSDHAYQQIANEVPDKFIRLEQTRSYNNIALLGHPNIGTEQHTALRNYFLTDQGRILLQPMLAQFAQDALLIKSVVTDYPDEYWQGLAPYWLKNTTPSTAD